MTHHEKQDSSAIVIVAFVLAIGLMVVAFFLGRSLGESSEPQLLHFDTLHVEPIRIVVECQPVHIDPLRVEPMKVDPIKVECHCEATWRCEPTPAKPDGSHPDPPPDPAKLEPKSIVVPPQKSPFQLPCCPVRK